MNSAAHPAPHPASGPVQHQVPRISGPILLFFRFMAWYGIRRRFTAARISDPHHLTDAGAGPLILYGNHSSWWDPMTLMLVARYLLPGRSHFAPMNRPEFERHPILSKIGIFGIDKDTPRGAATLLRKGLAILAHGGVLWITPQGRFADPRERPLNLRRGLAELAGRVPGGCTLIPIASEYPFWEAHRPELLLHVGPPIRVEGGDAATLLLTLESALLEAVELLQEKSISRDPARFELLAKARPRTLTNVKRNPFAPAGKAL